VADYGGTRRWSSKELGLLSIALSFFSFFLLLLADDLPASSVGLAVFVVQITVFLCATVAAERGSKMWLLVWLGPLFFTTALFEAFLHSSD